MNLNELNQLRLNMIEAKNKFDREANAYASQNCGVKIGEVIQVSEVSHRGKNMEVYKIGLRYDNWSGEYQAVLHGSVLKQDGSISRNSANTIYSLGKVDIK